MRKEKGLNHHSNSSEDNGNAGANLGGTGSNDLRAVLAVALSTLGGGSTVGSRDGGRGRDGLEAAGLGTLTNGLVNGLGLALRSESRRRSVALGDSGGTMGLVTLMGNISVLGRAATRSSGLLVTRAVGGSEGLGDDLADGAVSNLRRARGDSVDCGDGLGNGLGTASGGSGDRADGGVPRNSLGDNDTGARVTGGALGDGLGDGSVDSGSGQLNRRGDSGDRASLATSLGSGRSRLASSLGGASGTSLRAGLSGAGRASLRAGLGGADGASLSAAGRRTSLSASGGRAGLGSSRGTSLAAS